MKIWFDFFLWKMFNVWFTEVYFLNLALENRFLGSGYFKTAEGSEGIIVKRNEDVKSFVLQGYWMQLLLIDLTENNQLWVRENP